MRKLLIAAFIILLNVQLAYAEQETITLANGEWQPYMSKNLKHGGVVSRIVADAFELEGIKVEYKFISSWARAMKMTENGQMDGTLGWSQTDERLVHSFYSDLLGYSTQVFFHLKKLTFDWDKISDLKNMHIGGMLGWNYGEAFQSAEATKLIKVQRLPRFNENIKKLLLGRIEIVPEDKLVGYATILTMDLKPEEINLITNHPKGVREFPFYLLLSKAIKKNKRLIKLFNKGLKRLKDSGKYDQYYAESQRGEYMNQ